MTQGFPLGQITATPGALDTFTPEELGHALDKHKIGDWGDCCPEDRAENELAIVEGFRTLSAYTIRGQKLRIVRERDQSVTTALLPNEY